MPITRSTRRGDGDRPCHAEEQAQALAHDRVTGPHNATWMNYGICDKPVPSERAVHNLEHGAVWITCRRRCHSPR